jgi:3-deoxy-D-manno-octulosonic acid kinase
MQEQERRGHRYAILYDAECLRKAGLEPHQSLFEPEAWRSRAQVDIAAGGRGGVTFIRLPDGEDWVLRHYRRGGFVARFVDDRYLWTGADRTRSLREWRLLAQLRALRLPVPQPIAARYARHGAFYTADLITVAISNAETLAKRLIDGHTDADLWSDLGALIAAFHEHGVQHADLNAHNIVIDRAGRIYLLDFDRGRIRKRGPWEARVLQRLQRSLVKVGGRDVVAAYWRELRKAYDEASKKRVW